MVEIPFKIMHLLKELTPREAMPHSLDLWGLPSQPSPYPFPKAPSFSGVGGNLAGLRCGSNFPYPQHACQSPGRARYSKSSWLRVRGDQVPSGSAYPLKGLKPPPKLRPECPQPRIWGAALNQMSSLTVQE